MIKHNYSLTIYKEKNRTKGKLFLTETDQLDSFTVSQITLTKLLEIIDQTINEISELYNIKLSKHITIEKNNNSLIFVVNNYLIVNNRID